MQRSAFILTGMKGMLMKTLRLHQLIPFAVLAMILQSCSPAIYKEVYPTLIDGKYDSEFPYKGCSKQLEEISKSVKNIYTNAYYQTITFDPRRNVTMEMIRGKALQDTDQKVTYMNRSVGGTATVMFYRNRRMALLTCAHVVDFPDTIISYVLDRNMKPTSYVSSVAVKKSQSIFLADSPQWGSFDIVAMERQTDIAILGKTLEEEPRFEIPVFNYPFGKAKELEWGSFVYLFGYPSGFKMVTKGIVSNPKKETDGSFLVDAVVTRGCSGGVALAIRDGVPNFELVGMIKWVSGRSSYVLTPSTQENDVSYDPLQPYTGNAYVSNLVEIDYGITQAISIEAIQKFIQEHQRQLENKGYFLIETKKPS